MKLHRITTLSVALALIGSTGYSQITAPVGGAPVPPAAAPAAGATGAAAGGTVAGLSTSALIAIGAAVAVVAGAASSDSTTTTTTHIAGTTTTLADSKGQNLAAVFIQNNSPTVAALAGNVSYTSPNGTVTKIDVGTGRVVGPNGVLSPAFTLSELVATEKANGTAGNPNSATAGLAQVVNSVATLAASGQFKQNTGAIVAATLKAITAANPAAAGTATETLITAVAKSNLTPAEKQAAVTAAAEASLSTAKNPTERAALLAAISETVQENSASLGLSSAAVAQILTNANNSATVASPSTAITIPIVDTTVREVVSPSS